MKERHRHIATTALAVAGKYGLALAGGYAVHVHGMGNRPSEDVDLFADWQRRADFSTIVELVSEALEQAGYTVTVTTRFETFARLILTSPGDPAAGTEKLELSADWRSHPPVMMDIGPVLHPDDAVANKMSALYGRAEARDFIDIDSAVADGRYGPARLLELAAAADRGFDPVCLRARSGDYRGYGRGTRRIWACSGRSSRRCGSGLPAGGTRLLAGGDGSVGAA